MSLILIVEDDQSLQEALQAILEEEGYRVNLANDGLDGLDRIRDAEPELIMLDMMMPRMDGFAFVEELKRRGLRPRIPVLMLTADGNAPQKAERIGAEGFLVKPFDVPDLLHQISVLVRH